MRICLDSEDHFTTETLRHTEKNWEKVINLANNASRRDEDVKLSSSPTLFIVELEIRKHLKTGAHNLFSAFLRVSVSSW